MELLEPEAIGLVTTTLDQVVAHKETPQAIKDFVETIRAGKKPLPLLILIPVAIILLLPMIMGIMQPLSNLFNQTQERVFHSFRFDPISVMTLWRRDPKAYADFIDDLRDQGFSETRIAALKFLTLFYPAPADLIRWQAREVFEPEMVSKYGLDAELGGITREPFYKAGMTDEQITNYWRAHWEHASWIQVIEMLHRGLLTEAEVRDWFRLVEIPPFWRQKLIDTAYTWPTRVDVRRWWDMRTISEERLRELYKGMGYRGENLEDYIRWTKVYTDFPVMLNRWKNGWITLEDVREWLRGLDIPEERIDEFIQERVKVDEPERIAKDREITISDVYKGVKQNVITRSEAVDLLIDLGFDEEEAVYKLDVNIPPDEEEVIVKQRELSKTDIIKGLRTGIIDEPEAIQRLRGLRYNQSDSEFLVKIYLALIKPPEEPRQREASKADIILAVKKELITPEDAYLMLLDIGFTPEASEFILSVRAETSPFSPVTFAEFKDRTGKYKRATGREVKPMTEELKAAAAEKVRLTDEVEALKRAVKDEERGLIDIEVLPAEATARRDELQVALHRAESELSRVRSAFNRQVAEWKHGLA